ncbi:patatin-like phospholipase family protein [Candidatus Uabimicrobium sp. HlEnr_7]|uniref:patatin-like phospholipase family protein n=1 Tax=Candidatus Uabimicrobium helgolandensis TaxID=3095367 RepID=UPI0035563FB7
MMNLQEENSLNVSYLGKVPQFSSIVYKGSVIMRILIWKNYFKWLKKIFSSPKYYLGVILWLPTLLINIYFTVMLMAVISYGVIAWGIFALLGDPGFIKSSTSYSTQQIEKAIEIDSTGKMFIACCVSGGGSRSAIFAGETLYWLNTITEIEDPVNAFQNKTKNSTNILNTLDFISSVSGGTVTATSLCIHRPWESNSWKEFKKSLRIPFQHKLYQYLANPLYFGEIALTHRDRTNIIEKVWNDHLVENKKLGDLALRPRLVVNATSYNLGKKFVFTTLSKSNFNNMIEVYPSLFTNLDPFPAAAVTLDEYQLSSVNCPISTALAASSAFPVGLPPITITGYTAKQSIDIHLSDGGIYDNHGLESVLQLFKQKIDNYYNGLQMRIFGGLVFVIDASLPGTERFDSPSELDMILHTMEVYEKRMQIYFDKFLRDQVNLSNEIRIPLKFVRFSLGELIGIWRLAQKKPQERQEMLERLQQQINRGIHTTTLPAQQFLDEWFQKPKQWWDGFHKDCSEIIGDDVDSFMNQLQNMPTNFALSKKQTIVLEKASQLIFLMKKDEIIAAYKNLQQNMDSFKNIEDFTRQDVTKFPALYVFEFMRKLQLASNDSKVWVGEYAMLEIAIRRLAIPQSLRKRISKTIENLKVLQNQESNKVFDKSLQNLKEQCAKAFSYNSLQNK